MDKEINKVITRPLKRDEGQRNRKKGGDMYHRDLNHRP